MHQGLPSKHPILASAVSSPSRQGLHGSLHLNLSWFRQAHLRLQREALLNVEPARRNARPSAAMQRVLDTAQRGKIM